MRHLAFLLALLAATLIVVFILLSPAYLGDYRWVILALPVSLAVARELYEHTIGQSDETRLRRLVQLGIEPVEEDEPPDDGSDASPEGEAITGLWTGTVCVWPGTPEEVLRLLPVNLLIGDAGRSACVVAPDRPASGPRIAEARILEYDPTRESLDVQLVAQDGPCREPLDARLSLRRNRLASEDPGDRVTADLRRAAPVAVAM